MKNDRKKKFNGNLKDIEPRKIIGSSEHEDVASFFITLGLIYNDLKTLVWVSTIIKNEYETPGIDEISDHAGNINGINTYITKMSSAIVNEFFNFLKKRKRIFENKEFNKILNKLSKNDQDIWYDFIKIVNKESKSVNSLVSSLATIRNNVAYHFNDNGKLIIRGYKNFFLNTRKNKFNKKAYYSLGKTMENTRFYFSDATAQEITTHSFRESVNNHNIQIKDCSNFIVDKIKEMNFIISKFMKVYITFVRNENNW